MEIQLSFLPSDATIGSRRTTIQPISSTGGWLLLLNEKGYRIGNHEGLFRKAIQKL